MIEFEDVLCHATLSTLYWTDEEDDWMALHLEFKDGPLAGKAYKLEILKNDLQT